MRPTWARSRSGRTPRFTVSAYPSRKFPARITRVGFGSTITDNVVTYLTYLDVDNSDLSLRPGMTATATITATQRNDVLLVPNSALRFAPTAARRCQAGGQRQHRLQPDPAHARQRTRKSASAVPAPRRRARCGCCATARRCRWR